MPTRTPQLLALAGLLILSLPDIASAGDAPIFVVRDWGIGKIDGRIMLYFGKGRLLDTPIPAPPEGPRCDMVYQVAPFLALGACAAGLYGLYRRRHSQPLERTGQKA